jgi:hypothetical protein
VPREEDSVVEGRALWFRLAIRDALRLGDVALDDFPNGACGDCALLLGEYLFNGVPGKWSYRSGIRDGHTDAWLDKEGLAVDITADQFPDIEERVIVTSYSAWHAYCTHVSGDGQPALIDSGPCM